MGSVTAPALVGRALDDPGSVDDAGWAALLAADGAELEALCAAADEARAAATGDALTWVANRNLATAAVVGPTRLGHLHALLDEAVALGATEVCVQGPLPDADGQEDGASGRDDRVLDLVRAVRARAPGVHLHAVRPAEVADAAVRSGRTPAAWLAAARAAGLGSVPGTGARVLDDGVRAVLAGAPAGAPGGDLPVARWVELVAAAHATGLPSTATLVFGHVESPAQVVAHLRLLAALQDRAAAAGTTGFTELVAMPWTPGATAPLPDPLPPGGRRGPSPREVRAVHAVARLLLRGRVDHVQAAWPRLAPPLVEAVLRGGADDAGGLLLDGALDPSAGAEAGRSMTAADVEALAERLGRVPRQRTTVYGAVGGGTP